MVLSSPEQEMLVNQTATERYGLTADDVRAALRTVVEGTVATELRVGDRLSGSSSPLSGSVPSQSRPAGANAN